MAEKGIQWTDQQRRAIDARGSDVLVTASAGTGKTAVLSGRCVSIVSDRAICPDVRNVLVLTFTEAAAEQMRSRIAERLREAYLDRHDDHLRRQLMLLQGADISTIHSFCKRLITEYFYKLDLDPTFSVIDGDEQRLLKSEILEKNIDWAWQQDDVRAALENLLYRRDLWTSDGFLRKITEISDFLDGVISREDWYERASQLAKTANQLTTGLGEKQRRIIGQRLQSIIAQLNCVQELYKNEGGEDTSWNDSFRKSHVEPVERCTEMLKASEWDKCAETIRNFQKPKTYKPKEIAESVAMLIQSIAKKAVDSFVELSQLAVISPDYLDRLGDSVELQTMVLIELVRQYDELYSKAKRALNCLDFADLEHYALRLLTSEDSTDEELLPSQTALALRQRYRHIFVDEYQDINVVQQQILTLLGSGDNVLGVGDGKQSIYAFRGAQPDIFLDQVKRASFDSGRISNGLRVDLNVNFRSAKGILDFVNAIFSRIMTASFSRIDYDESAMLNPGLSAEEPSQITNAEERIVELHILDEEKAETEQSQTDVQNEASLVSARRRQAAMIARRIRAMVGADTSKAEFQIFDKHKGCQRDVDYRDIVVLMRSLAKKASDYVEIFRLAGVPVSCQATAGYFEATEISDMLCLLKVLDNPQRDIELAAVLRSPFFKISDTELARIKIYERKGPPRTFYDRVLGYSLSGVDELAEKLTAILEGVELWRTQARRGNIADLIWRIYRETSLLSFVSALPNGQARRANLLKLHDRAIQFESFTSSTGIPSLTRFVDFIEKLQARSQDWAPAEPQGSVGNAVRILSVHKSKGLEFPVVFLADLDSPFNMKDVQADCLADAQDTLGLQIIDRPSNSKISSIAHEVIVEQKRSTTLAEEMRILYVATTRAKSRLVLTASAKQRHCRESIRTGVLLGRGAIPDWQLRTCRSPLEWILFALSDQRPLHEVFETGLSDRAIDDNLFDVHLHREVDLKRLSDYVLGLKSSRPIRHSTGSERSQSKRRESQQFNQIKKSMSWRYPFRDASWLPAKSSVTQLTHAHDEYIQYDYSRTLECLPGVVMAMESDVDKPVEARLIGTATHLVISELDFNQPVTDIEIEKARDKLVADKNLSLIIGEHIDIASILTFFESELGQLALDSSNSVWREWPFTFALPISEWKNSFSTQAIGKEIRDTIIVQGMVDLLIQTSQGLVIVDFKTDKVSADQVSERAELYRRQLALYGRAASAILRSEMIARWLYFLSPGCSIEV